MHPAVLAWLRHSLNHRMSIPSSLSTATPHWPSPWLQWSGGHWSNSSRFTWVCSSIQKSLQTSRNSLPNLTYSEFQPAIFWRHVFPELIWGHVKNFMRPGKIRIETCEKSPRLWAAPVAVRDNCEDHSPGRACSDPRALGKASLMGVIGMLREPGFTYIYIFVAFHIFSSFSSCEFLRKFCISFCPSFHLWQFYPLPIAMDEPGAESTAFGQRTCILVTELSDHGV